MDERTIIYLVGCAAPMLIALTNITAYGPLNILILIIVLLGVLLLLILNYADFLVFPALTSLLKVSVQLSHDHIVPKSEKCIIKHVKGLYYATGYLTANIYGYVFSEEIVSGDEEGKMVAAPELWEKVVMNTEFPFKFNVVASTKQVQKYREELEGQRGYLEFTLSKEQQQQNPNQLTITEIQRKIAILQARINRVSEGELPVESIMYIESTAVGVSEKEAVDELQNQLNHLETVLSAFDLSITRVTGREMHTLFKLNYRVFSRNEMLTAFQIQK